MSSTNAIRSAGAALALLLCATCAAEDGYVQGKGICYWFDTPSGWVMDNTSGKEQAIPMVFYPAGSSWADATAAIYTRNADFVAGAESDEQKVQGQVERVLTRFRSGNESPDSKARLLQPIQAGHGAKGQLWSFTGDKFGNTELVAYFVGPNTVNFFVLSSRDAEDAERAKPALLQLAATYREGDDCVPCNAAAGTSCGGQPHAKPAARKPAAPPAPH